uniref:RING-type domain-containing protein n=1 Tax=Fagus sylvatica TaxID=28930 RepID=A0A2N9IHX4_FAGSY
MAPPATFIIIFIFIFMMIHPSATSDNSKLNERWSIHFPDMGWPEVFGILISTLVGLTTMLCIVYQVYKRCCMQPQPQEAQDGAGDIFGIPFQLYPPPPPAPPLPPLPRTDYHAAGDIFGIPSCPICLEDFVEGESVVELPCHHAYHPACIDSWVTQNPVCPVCMAQVPPPLDQDPLV